MNKLELVNLLDQTETETLSLFSLSDAELDKTYGHGKWTVRQILHHLVDCEILFHGRLKKIIAEPKQVIQAFMQDEWCRVFEYDKAPVAHKREAYKVCRALNKALIVQFYDQMKDKEFVHSETGLRTLQMECEKVAVHNQTHLQQIQTALTS